MYSTFKRDPSGQPTHRTVYVLGMHMARRAAARRRGRTSDGAGSNGPRSASRVEGTRIHTATTHTGEHGCEGGRCRYFAGGEQRGRAQRTHGIIDHALIMPSIKIMPAIMPGIMPIMLRPPAKTPQTADDVHFTANYVA